MHKTTNPIRQWLICVLCSLLVMYYPIIIIITARKRNLGQGKFLLESVILSTGPSLFRGCLTLIETPGQRPYPPGQRPYPPGQRPYPPGQRPYPLDRDPTPWTETPPILDREPLNRDRLSPDRPLLPSTVKSGAVRIVLEWILVWQFSLCPFIITLPSVLCLFIPPPITY